MILFLLFCFFIVFLGGCGKIESSHTISQTKTSSELESTMNMSKVKDIVLNDEQQAEVDSVIENNMMLEQEYGDGKFVSNGDNNTRKENIRGIDISIMLPEGWSYDYSLAGEIYIDSQNKLINWVEIGECGSGYDGAEYYDQIVAIQNDLIHRDDSNEENIKALDMLQNSLYDRKKWTVADAQYKIFNGRDYIFLEIENTNKKNRTTYDMYYFTIVSGMIIKFEFNTKMTYVDGATIASIEEVMNGVTYDVSKEREAYVDLYMYVLENGETDWLGDTSLCISDESSGIDIEINIDTGKISFESPSVGDDSDGCYRVEMGNPYGENELQILVGYEDDYDWIACVDVPHTYTLDQELVFIDENIWDDEVPMSDDMQDKLNSVCRKFFMACDNVLKSNCDTGMQEIWFTNFIGE